MAAGPPEGPRDDDTRGSDAHSRPEAVRASLRRARHAEQRLADLVAELRQLQSGNEGHRERVTQELEGRYREHRDRLLIASLAVLDKLDRALDAARDTGAAAALTEGLVLVRSLLVRIVQEEGLERIPVLGLTFNPAVSVLVGTRSVDDPARHQLVVDEVEAGHRIGGHIARLAKVIVGEYRAPVPVAAAEIVPLEAALPPEPAPAPFQEAERVAAADLEPEPVAPAGFAAGVAPPPPEATPPAETAPPEPEPRPAAVAAAEEQLSQPSAAVQAPEPVLAEEAAPPEALALPETARPEAAAAPTAPAAEPAVIVLSPVPPLPAAAETRVESSSTAPTPRTRPARRRPARRAGLYAVLGLVAVAAGVAIMGRGWLQPGSDVPPAPAPRAANVGPAPRAPSVAPSLTPPTSVVVAPPLIISPASPGGAKLSGEGKQPGTSTPPPAGLPSAPARTPPPRTLSPPPSPSPLPSAVPETPRPQEPSKTDSSTTQIARLLTDADTALSGHRYEEAIALFNAVLSLDAQNQSATDGRGRAVLARDLSRRTFVADRTSVRTRESQKGLGGFETEDVQVSRPPRDTGRIDFETRPPSPKAGETYSVTIYLSNLGQKPFRLESVTVTTTSGGAKSGGPVSLETREVGPGKRALLFEESEVWSEGTSSWHMDVVVTTPHGETFTNRLDWR